jgi:phosphoribosylaminoimidazolecarboxamide formyltransferase/IMP cyclohydrolase
MTLPDVVQIRRALLSVFDKTGVVELAQALHDRGVEILSTGGTARLLQESGIPIVEVGEHTGFPEMMDGRVKTLHPKIHGGLLARRDLDEHLAAMDEHDIAPIDLVAVNLYPFEQVAQKADVDWATLIENIDIGGPSMLRSAAKNHAAVAVVCDPSDYPGVIGAVQDDGGLTLAERSRLALKVYARTAAYDATIAGTLAERADAERREQAEDKPAPPTLVLGGQLAQTLRYGENPHQAAAVYTSGTDALDLAGAVPLQGKALSYNNLLDTDAALFSLRCLTDDAAGQPAASVIKHGTPCGAARGGTLVEAWTDALSGDPVSAFGGIVALSHEVDEATASAMSSTFLEVVLAPAFSEGARQVFAKKKNLRLIELPELVTAPLPRQQIRSVPGGLLVQDHDRAYTTMSEAEVATKRAPTDAEWAALDVAFRLSAAVRSNAITLAAGNKLIGAGGGQTSRVDAVRLAIAKAREHGHEIEGAALGSDAFFPFPDGVEAAAKAGVKAVAQPGGSKRDGEVIEACDRLGLAMVFTGERHFRH